MVNDSDLIKSQAHFGIHLDGDSEIDAILLSKTIADITELTQLVAKSESPEAYMKMNVTAFKNGSFQIDFSTVCEVAEMIGSAAVVCSGLAATVVAAVKGTLEIKNLLKGEKPKSIKPDETNTSKICVENNEGSTIIVNKNSAIVISNFRADQLASNIANYAKVHNPQAGFSFISEEGTSLYCVDDILEMAKPLPVVEEFILKKSRIQAVLPIKKADILGRSSWDFRYNGHAITAKIEDEDFLETVHSGAAVKAGDYINALLEVAVNLDIEGKPVDGTDQYTIVQVYNGIQHTKEYEQSPL